MLQYIEYEKVESKVEDGVYRVSRLHERTNGAEILGYLVQSPTDATPIIEVGLTCPDCGESPVMLMNFLHYIWCPLCHNIYDVMFDGSLIRKGVIWAGNSHYMNLCRDYLAIKKEINCLESDTYFVV